MGDFFKKPVVIIIVVVAIVGALIWSYVSNLLAQRKANQASQQAAEQTITDLTNVDPINYDEPVKKEYALASAKAKEVNPNYQLAAVEVDLPASLALNSGNDRYIFVADKDKVNNWVITLSLETGNFIRSLIPKEDYMGNPAVLDNKLWKFNYVTALQIVEKDGGKTWRENNDLQSVTLILKHTDPNNYLTWSVTYQGENSSLFKKIDANSGKVLETQ